LYDKPSDWEESHRGDLLYPATEQIAHCSARSVIDHRRKLHEQRRQRACLWHVMQGMNMAPTPKIGAGNFI
jgi:hypothetical protein